MYVVAAKVTPLYFFTHPNYYGMTKRTTRARTVQGGASPSLSPSAAIAPLKDPEPPDPGQVSQERDYPLSREDQGPGPSGKGRAIGEESLQAEVASNPAEIGQGFDTAAKGKGVDRAERQEVVSLVDETGITSEDVRRTSKKN